MANMYETTCMTFWIHSLKGFDEAQAVGEKLTALQARFDAEVEAHKTLEREKQGRIDQLTADLGAANAAYKKLEEEKAAAIADATEKLDAKSRDLELAQNELRNQAGLLAASTAKADHLTTKLALANADLKSAGEEAQRLQESEDALKAALSTTQVQLSTSQSSCDKLNRTLTSTEQQLRDTQSKLQSKTTELDTANISIANLKQDVTALNALNVQLELQLANMAIAFEQASTLSVETLTNEQNAHKHTTDQLNSTKQELSDEQAHHDATKKDRDAKQRKVVSLEDKLAAKTAELEAEVADHTQTKNELNGSLMEIDKQTKEIHGLRDMIHFPGISSTGDPSQPRDFIDRLELVFVHLKTYSGFVMRGFTARTKAGRPEDLIKFFQKATKYAAGQDYDKDDLPIDESLYRKAILIAAMSRALFQHYESDTFDSESLSLPGPCEVAGLKAQRKKYRKEYDTIVGTVTSQLKENDAMATWFRGVIARLKAALVDNDEDWAQIFESTATESGPQLWEVAKHVWALHKLARTYALLPHIIRFPAFERVNPELCKSFFHGEAGVKAEAKSEYTVFCTVLPGFQLDNNPTSCEVLWV